MPPLPDRATRAHHVRRRPLRRSWGSLGGRGPRTEPGRHPARIVAGWNESGRVRCREHGHECMTPPDIVKEESKSKDGVRLRLYRVGELLGKGGFARVYRFTEISSGKDFACKVVSKCRLGEKKEGKAKLRTEVRIHSGLQSDRVVRLLRYFQDAQRVFLVLDLCEGPSMAEMVKAHGLLTEPETRFYTRQLLEAVVYLHSQNIMHRDLKIQNILLTSDMQLKLCDFGLACRLESHEERLNDLVGTANTVAPEVIAAGTPGSTSTYSLEADMWGIGVVMYNMIFGVTPFDSDEIRETFRLIQAGKYTFPDDVTISEDAKHLISSLLNPDPASRLSAEEALRHRFFLGHSTPVPLYRTPFENRTNCPLNVSAKGKCINYGRQQFRRSRPNDRRPRPSWGRSNDSYGQYTRYRGRRWSGGNGSFSSQQSDHPLEHRKQFYSSDRKQFSSDRPAESLSASKVRRLSLEAGPINLGPPVDLRPVYAELWEQFASNLRKAYKWMTQGTNSKREGVRRFQLVAKPAGDDMPPYVTKWLDYTSKYAFITLLSDNRICGNFNDGSTMFYWSESQTVPDIAYISGNSTQRSISDTTDLKFRMDVAKKAKLLSNFRVLFADENEEEIELPATCNVSFLGENGTFDDEGAAAATVRKLLRIHGENNTGLVYVRDWHRSRSQKAVAFRLSNSTVHVKFNSQAKEKSEDVLVDLLRKRFFYCMKDGSRWVCSTDELAEFATHSQLVYERLLYTNRILSRFVS